MMKTVLLAGGFGTRISEYSEFVPKPLIKIGDQPILWHIMKWYASFGHEDFIVALGYKAQSIKEFFLNYHALNSDFKIDLRNGQLEFEKRSEVSWKVSLCDTGLHTMTGGRLRRLRDKIGNETFMLTYGDGLSDVDINDLIKFHKSHGKMVTMTAVRPNARFGELEITGDMINSFQEKPQLKDGWINGGYFVCEPEFLNLIPSDETLLEREPLETVAKSGQLMAYKHTGFWQCMDTKRDHDLLNRIWLKETPPWKPSN